jgi:outer membrane receptor for ferrienterochelin and colicin
MKGWMPRLRTIVPLVLLLGQFPRVVPAGEGEDFEDLDLEELLDVVYTASKHEQNISESPSAITVISREQIENSWCTDVVCLLRQVPEMDVVRVRPMHAAVGARAFTDEMGEKVLLLIDGKEINSEVFGVVMWQALPIHLEDIERIEVIRGPGSALYGANAHSAVVSIFTRDKVENTAEVFLGSGELGRHSLHARLGRELGDWRLRLSGGMDAADSWHSPGRRQREVARVWLQANRESLYSKSGVLLGLSSAEGHIYHVLGPAQLRDAIFVDAMVTHRVDFLEAKLSFNLLKGIIPIKPEGEGPEAINYQGVPLGRLPNHIPFVNPTLDAEAQVTLSPWSGNLLVAGGNYRWIAVFSDETLPGEIHQHRVGAFVQDEQLVLKNLIVTGGVRFDYNSITPLTFSPRLAGVYGFTENNFVRLAFGMAFRKPSFFNSSIHIKNVEAEPAFPEFEDFFHRAIGNKYIENENITSFEAGYTGRFLDSRLTVEADAFYNRYRDTITFNVDMRINEFGVPDLVRSSALYNNEGRDVDSLGGSVSVTWRLQHALRLSANYTYRYSFYASDPGGIAVAGEGKKGERLTWEPAHLANLSVGYLPRSGPRMGLGWHYTSPRVGSVSRGSAFDPRVPISEPAASVFGGFASWRFQQSRGWIEVGIRAYNLFSLRFRDFPGEIRPDGYEMGGLMLNRRIFLYFRGAV